MPRSGDDRRAVPECKLVRLFCIVHFTLADHVAGLALFVKNSVSNPQITHGGKAGRCRNRRIESQLLSIFLANEHDALLELACTVLIHHTEQISDDGFLPLEQLERLTEKRALRVFQALDEQNGPVCLCLVIM